MHEEEARLTCILRTISRAGITCTSMLRAQPPLWRAFTASLTSWMSKIPLRSKPCLGIIRSCNTSFEDVADIILCKLLEPERRPDRNKKKPYTERLCNALHPQLDLILSLNAEQNARAAIRYLVTTCQTCCEDMKPAPDPIETPEEVVESSPAGDATPESGVVRKHAIASFTSDLQHKEIAFTIVRQLDGQRFLHDYAILGMRLLRLKCNTLVTFLINDQAASSAEEMVEMLSTMIAIDCKNDEALSKFIGAARKYRLPARYKENPGALEDKLYRATNSKSMTKFQQRVLNALA